MCFDRDTDPVPIVGSISGGGKHFHWLADVVLGERRCKDGVDQFSRGRSKRLPSAKTGRKGGSRCLALCQKTYSKVQEM
jgi:hypothetical protein